MKASFGASVCGLKKKKNVFFDDATYKRADAAAFNPNEEKAFDNIIRMAEGSAYKAGAFIDKLKKEHEVHGYDYNENHKPALDGYDWVIHLGAISSTTERDVDKIMLQNYEFSKWILLSH